MASPRRRRSRVVAPLPGPPWFENPWLIGGGVAAVAALVLVARAAGAATGAALGAGLGGVFTPTGTPRRSPSGGGSSTPLPSAPSSLTSTVPPGAVYTPAPGFYDPYAPATSTPPSATPSADAGGCTTMLVFAQSGYASPGDWFSNGAWSAGSVVTVLEKRTVGATPWFRVRSQAGVEAWIVPASEQRAPCFV